MPERIGWLESLVLGIVEGVTEFLPVSSTGHLIVANRLLGGTDPAFEVAIQIGAISAIAVLYRERLMRAARELFENRGGGERLNLFLLLVIAALPAGVLGLALGDLIQGALFNPSVVATTLVAGGALLLVLERWIARRADDAPQRALDDMTAGQAFAIGCVQCLALIPGTSRSGATIAGALLMRFDRVAAAEFSFLVGLPVLYGACILEVVGDPARFFGPLLPDFVLGCVVSFVTAWVVVGPFVRYLQAHTFVAFGWYRIVFGGALFALIGAGVL